MFLDQAPELRSGAATQTETLARSDTAQDSGGSLTRADLALAVQKTMGYASREAAAECVDQFFSELFEVIVSGEDVLLSGFGSFNIREKRERIGRNPKTRVDAVITARRVVTFKPSGVLRSRVNGGGKRKRRNARGSKPTGGES